MSCKDMHFANLDLQLWYNYLNMPERERISTDKERSKEQASIDFFNKWKKRIDLGILGTSTLLYAGLTINEAYNSNRIDAQDNRLSKYQGLAGIFLLLSTIHGVNYFRKNSMQNSG